MPTISAAPHEARAAYDHDPELILATRWAGSPRRRDEIAGIEPFLSHNTILFEFLTPFLLLRFPQLDSDPARPNQAIANISSLDKSSLHVYTVRFRYARIFHLRPDGAADPQRKNENKLRSASSSEKRCYFVTTEATICMKKMVELQKVPAKNGHSGSNTWVFAANSALMTASGGHFGRNGIFPGRFVSMDCPHPARVQGGRRRGSGPAKQG